MSPSMPPSTPPYPLRRRALQGLLLAPAVPLLAGCGALTPSTQASPGFYTLEAAFPAAPAAAADAPTLLVQPPRASAGFDSQRIIYLREANRLEYFAHNEWVDPPARMLGPLLVEALQSTGAYHAVLLAPSAHRSQLQLDTQVLRLQQEFTTRPSQVRFGLRASLGDARTRRVLATRDVEAVVTARADTPEGGVLAANEAVRLVLAQLAAFCRDTPLPVLPSGGNDAGPLGRRPPPRLPATR